MSDKKPYDTTSRRVDKTCAHCGRQFSVELNESRRGRGKFCSDRCRKVGRAQQWKSRFWQSVEKTESGCWLWTRDKRPNGYGRLWVEGRVISTHRVAYELANGSIPSGSCVLHRCDVRLCVNPAHLFLGTHADNAADRAAKGRNNTQRGERAPRTKLTAAQVLELRQRHGTESGRKLAREFGISPQTVCDIARGRSWLHLEVTS